MRLFNVGLSLVLGAAALAAADAPYAGKWKLNATKSDFGSFTLTYAQLPSREMQATLEGQSYTFKMEGRQSKSSTTGNSLESLHSSRKVTAQSTAKARRRGTNAATGERTRMARAAAASAMGSRALI